MPDASVAEHHAKGAAVYVGRLSLGRSFRSEKAVLLVSQAGLALHRPGRFEKYHAIPYEEINFYDLGRRWNGMVLSVGTDDHEYHFRFFRPRGDLAAIVVALNQRLQGESKPFRARYALTQLEPDAEEEPQQPDKQHDAPRSKDAGSSDAALRGGSKDPHEAEIPWSSRQFSRRINSSERRVFSGDRSILAPLARVLPKLIILALALYSVIASGLWQKGVDTMATWLQQAAEPEQIVVTPASPEALDPHKGAPAPVEENLSHVPIDLSEHANVAAMLKAQRIQLSMTPAQAATEAGLAQAVVERIEAGSDVVSLSDFLRYAKAVDLDIATTRQIIDRY